VAKLETPREEVTAPASVRLEPEIIPDLRIEALRLLPSSSPKMLRPETPISSKPRSPPPTYSKPAEDEKAIAPAVLASWR